MRVNLGALRPPPPPQTRGSERPLLAKRHLPPVRRPPLDSPQPTIPFPPQMTATPKSPTEPSRNDPNPPRWNRNRPSRLTASPP
ncbi:hypothetical protein ILUMI_16231 [Ignelater luminosus]|uniref:Uncharacterized protein n=1 Tax=Ignelater luminosus TaxID=2038154 RepID=A0A8K0CTB9_IGNLU|nr:hypothetical protein ILUMI_16231 [Ignelater luminosus]